VQSGTKSRSRQISPKKPAANAMSNSVTVLAQQKVSAGRKTSQEISAPKVVVRVLTPKAAAGFKSIEN